MNQPQQYQAQTITRHKVSNRTRITAILLAFFLGGVGAHKFYLGQAGQGIIYLLLFWTFIPAFVAFVEMIVMMTQSDEQFDRQYNYA